MAPPTVDPPFKRPNARSKKKLPAPSRARKQPSLNRGQMLLLSAVVIATTGILTVLLRKTVQEYIVSPITTLARFVHSLINLLSERTQLAFVVVVGALLLGRFTLKRFRIRPKIQWLERLKPAKRKAMKSRARLGQTSLDEWREAFRVGGSTKLATDVVALQIRTSVLDAMTRNSDLTAKSIIADAHRNNLAVPDAVREIIVGTPTWLRKPHYLPNRIQNTFLFETIRDRFPRPISESAIAPLHVVVSYVESLSFGDAESNRMQNRMQNVPTIDALSQGNSK